jgi:hypothetical protein
MNAILFSSYLFLREPITSNFINLFIHFYELTVVCFEAGNAVCNSQRKVPETRNPKK